MYDVSSSEANHDKKRSAREQSTSVSNSKRIRLQRTHTNLFTQFHNRTARQVELDKQFISRTRAQMDAIVKEYVEQDFPTAQAYPGYDSNDYMHARAYIEADEYLKQYPGTLIQHNMPELKYGLQTQRCHMMQTTGLSYTGCGSKLALHKVTYYDTGLLGCKRCSNCNALLLRSEHRTSIRCKSKCCNGGQSCTLIMEEEYQDLQHPPDELKDQLLATDKQLRDVFLNNTIPLNNKYAFASITANKAPDELMGGRQDTCKYNGAFCFNLSDLLAPTGKQPLFAQTYMLAPDEAQKLRFEQFTEGLGSRVGRDVFRILEHIMRKYNPFAQTFQTYGEMAEAERLRSGSDIPEFKIVLLTKRELATDALVNLPGAKVIERVDLPTAKQVAVIWVSDEGIAPTVQGVFLRGKQNSQLIELDLLSPLIEPTCFPLLFPKGTLGWRWDLKKRAYITKHTARRDEGLQIMDEALLEAQLAEIADFEQDSNDEQTELNDQNEQELDVDLPDPVPSESEVDAVEEQSTSDAVYACSVTTKTRDDFLADEPFVQARLEGGPCAFNAQSTRERITHRQHTLYNLQWRESSKHAFHWLWFARRLAEFYLISVLNRIERNDMEYVRKLQMEHPRRKILARDFVAAIESHLAREHAGAKLGQIFIMPSRFAGSRQFYNEKYADLMSMVRKTGAPTWFVTFTGNPAWPELLQALPPGQDYTTRPDIVCRVFIDKATEFLHDVIKRHVLGKVIAYCYSTEHQKRGMPHLHLLLVLSKRWPIRFPEQVDQYVQARIVPLPSMTDMSDEACQQRRLWYMVKTSMLHDCNKACQGENGRCIKYFPKKFASDTVLSDDRYSEYKRLSPTDQETTTVETDEFQPTDVSQRRLRPDSTSLNWEECGLELMLKKKKTGVTMVLNDQHVIPYSPYLLLKFGSHINVEYVFGQKATKYIFKYLLKGFEKAFVKVCQPAKKESNVYDYDEITSTFKVRYMTAMEAFMRLTSYPIVRLSHDVYKLGVHEERGQQIVINPAQLPDASSVTLRDSRLTAFFKLCSSDSFAETLTYDRIPYFYRWDAKNRQWIRRVYNFVEEGENSRMVVRIYTVSPKRQELFALRCLLFYKPGPKSYRDLRTIDGFECSTFGEAAERAGLLESDDIYFRAMEDANAQFKDDISLRRYFALLVLHCQPANPQKLLLHFLDQLYPPPAVRGQNRLCTSDYRLGKVLMHVEYFLRVNGSSCSDVGLHGLPEKYNFQEHSEEIEDQIVREEFYGSDINDATRMSPQEYAIRQLSRLNSDQRKAFERISEAFDDVSTDEEKKKLFFIEGSGGSGKTFFYNVLIKWCMAGRPSSLHNAPLTKQLNRNAVITAASTGIASLLLFGGSTAHRQFCVPNDVTVDTVSRIGGHTILAQRLREVEMIVIDEVSMLHIDVLKYIDRVLRDVCATQKPFGGKVVVLGGDWRQLAPVVEGGNKWDQINASLKMSPMFREFETLKLTLNMRTGVGERKFAEQLLDIGEGKQNGQPTPVISIAKQNQAAKLEDIVDFCFPPDLFHDPLSNADYITQAALLCPRNDDVAFINKLTTERMRGKLEKCISVDMPLNSGDEMSPFTADFNLESVHDETPNGFPPHLLHVKVGAPVMLLRNIDLSQGLANGTRMQILGLTDTNLTVRILTGPKADLAKKILIPLVKFEQGRQPNHRGSRFTRLQFPIRVCFAMTVNKSQGQTLQRVGLVLYGKQCFSHGQVYVAFSRVTAANGIRVLASPLLDGVVQIRNVVYRELLS